MKMKTSFNKNIISTLILIVFISVCFGGAGYRINKLTTKACYNTLEDTASQVATDICDFVQKDQEQLEIIADLLSQHEDLESETVKRHLSSFKQRGALGVLGLLLPDNELLLGNEEEGIPNAFVFENEISKLPYISGVICSPDNEEEKYIYQAVPVKKEEEVIGVLYGFVNLETFADEFTVTAFDGNAQVYVADGKTGDFLMDTWHDTLGNIFDEELLKRKVKSGYDYQKMKQDFVEGKTGYIAFWSNTAGEYFYSYYQPVGVDQWMVQLTVPESIVFADAARVRRGLYIVAAAEILAFLLYFLWVLSNVHRDSLQKERQLAQTIYMYDVQRSLFDAHKNPLLLTTALRKVSDMLTSEEAFLIALEKEAVVEVFFSADEKRKLLTETGMKQQSPYILKCLDHGESVLFYSEDRQKLQGEKDWEELQEWGISNMMLVPVCNSSDELIGVLGSINMTKHWTDCTLLECVSRNFMMALSNIQSYRQIERMGMIDILTGMQNRNSYELCLEELKRKNEDTLCCIYIDANGLHELNNTLGHAAGDEMLFCIGDSLKMIFGHSNCYRIGGDEFTAFCTKCSEEQVQQRMDKLYAHIESKGYHISVGIAWLKSSFDVQDMVSEAESNMYKAKQLYYQKEGNLSKARIMNQKLESILLEKKDADAFLDIIASRFMGVYMVDMNENIARVIYQPSYFSEILEENHYHFIPSMQAYIDAYVSEINQEEFRTLLDYDSVQQQLSTDKMIKYSFRKKDGTRLVLRIYPVTNYGEDHSHSLWMFEREYT